MILPLHAKSPVLRFLRNKALLNTTSSFSAKDPLQLSQNSMTHINYQTTDSPHRYGWLIIFTCALLSYLTSIVELSAGDGPNVMVEHAVERPLIEEARLSGSVVSPQIAKLSVQISGQVETFSVELGDHITTGAEILRLDSELETLALAEAQAATEKVREELSDARRRLAASQKLSKSGAVPEDEIESLSSEVRVDEAEFKRIQAQERRWQARLRRHQITAPFDGVISRKWTESGEWLDPGDPVIELTNVTKLYIDFQTPQSVWEKIDPKTEILIKLDAHPGRMYKGKIDWLMPVANAQTRTFQLRASVEDETASLAPGMSASALLRLNSGKQGVTVPRDAILRHPDGRIVVWVAKRDGESVIVSERRVETGIQFEGMVAISEGLSPGELIVVRGNESLRNDQNVTIHESPMGKE